MTKRKVDTLGLTFRSSDPKEYGFICPHCSKRYGKKHPLGVIEITRCSKCPTLREVTYEWQAKKKASERACYQKRKDSGEALT